MLIYLITYAISTCFVVLSENTKNKKRAYVYLALAVTSLTVLAMLRGTNVGADTAYFNEWFLDAQNYRGDFWGYYANFPSYHNATAQRPEILFELIYYEISILTNNIYIMRFIIYSIMYGLIMGGICANNYGVKRSVSWLAFCFLFHAMSLNIMRQMLAQAVLFWVFMRRERYTWWKGLLACVIAITIHSGSVIWLVYYLGYEVLAISKKRKWRTVLAGLFAGAPLMIYVGLSALAPLWSSQTSAILHKIGHYATFGDGGALTGNAIRAAAERFFVLLPFFWFVIRRWKKNEETTCGLFDHGVAWHSVLFMLNNSVSFARIVVFPALFSVNYIPAGIEQLEISQKNKRIVYVMLFILLGIFWYVKYILHTHSDIYPYSFYFAD